jgi:hypothetical protein
MRVTRVLMGLVVAILLLTSQSILCAQDKIELQPPAGIREILTEFTGKRVSVTLDSGAELGGIITKVGDHLVHISRLTGKEYFDALIRIDKISSVTIRTRTDR